MRVMMSCGEPSGDVYAGALAAEIIRRHPAADIFGLGGHRLAAAGARLVGHFSGLSVTGLTEALRVLPRSAALLRRLVQAARDAAPDVFVAIDFPDFNFRLMAALRRLGIPIVYYVSPQLWAWRPGRIETMKRHVECVIVIFPFEEEIYRRAGIPVRFVGHPLLDLAAPRQAPAAWLTEIGLDPAAPTVALLPGSRRNEVLQTVPVMAAALEEIRARVSRVQFVVAGAPNLPDPMFAPLLQRAQAMPVVLVRERTDEAIAASDVAVTASGTATVQCALHERPMVVVYRLSPLTYRLGKPFVKVDMYAMPNLVAGRRVVPELIQEGFTAGRVAEETCRLLTDSEHHAQVRHALRDVRARLGPPGATARAADVVLDIARRARHDRTSA